MSDNTQSSSASSLVNSAAGAVREGIAKVTGNPHDAAAADSKKGTSQLQGELTVQTQHKRNGMLLMRRQKSVQPL